CGSGLLVASLPPAAGRPPVLLVADPDLLNNQGLGRADHAAVAVALFARRLDADGAVFDETIHGFTRSRGLLAEAFHFPLLPGVLQGLLLLALVLWAGTARFGRALPPDLGLPPGKEGLIANTAQLLAQGGRVADSLRRYHQQTLRAVAARYFLPPDLAEAELARRLTEIGRQRGRPLDVVALGQRIETFAASEGFGRQRQSAVARAMVFAQRLHHWRREMTDGN
ncbi:MAG TPA: hypothetical protein VMM92_01025, partial [Thermoanaerobaculia bacterium]|nr:hypothetical protein [Thermoanaerobaculia bacterium]